MNPQKEKTLKVFVSSTYRDLVEYREKAVEVILRYRHLPLAMEHTGARAEAVTTVSYEDAEACDIFIGIYAHRYGFIPEGGKQSITQLEYELARKLKKPCLCFIIDEEQPWKKSFIEFEKQNELAAFLAILRKETTHATFTSTVDFESKLASALANQIQKMDKNLPDENEDQRPGKLIPIAPTPFIAHRYPLQKNFTGRQAEKSLLSNWFHNGAEPLLVLEAIGGMGKSSLSWVWLQEEILAPNTELDGIIWWSFYDAPFESFLPALLRYITSKKVKMSKGAYVFGDELSKLYSILLNNRFQYILDGF